MISFDPVLYSLEENAFLLQNIGKPPIVALRNVQPPINVTAVRPVLERIFELQQLEEHEGVKWGGLAPIRDAILSYLRENAKWEADWKRTRGQAPRFPSLYSFDARGRGHLGGPGSDAGHVRTYFDAEGKRQKFEVPLFPDQAQEWIPPGVTEIPLDPLLCDDAETNRLECRVPVGTGICGHTESYRPDSRASKAAARARMSKHLRRATENVDQHRELHTNEFGA